MVSRRLVVLRQSGLRRSCTHARTLDVRDRVLGLQGRVGRRGPTVLQRGHVWNTPPDRWKYPRHQLAGGRDSGHRGAANGPWRPNAPPSPPRPPQGADQGRQRTGLSRVTGTPHRQPEMPGSPPGRPHPRRNATVRPTPRPSGCRAARTRARSRHPRRRRGAFDLAAGNFMLGRLPLCFDQNPLNGVCHGLPPVIGSADVSVGLSSEFPANPCGNGPARRIVRWTAAPALGGHFPYFRPRGPQLCRIPRRTGTRWISPRRRIGDDVPPPRSRAITPGP